MSRRSRLRALGATACVAGIVVLPTGAHAARTCAVPKYSGGGYFSSLSVTRTTCASGRRVALDFQACRRRSGVAGHCKGRVRGYACAEKRVSIQTEFDGRVTCRRGHQRVVHTYQQNT